MAMPMIVVVIVIAPSMAIVSLVTAIPAVVVLEAPARRIPVPGKIPLAVMMRPNPNGAFEGRTGPITLVPPVTVSNRIPITLYPHETGTWSVRLDEHHGRRWRRRANLNADRNIRREGGARGHHNES